MLTEAQIVEGIAMLISFPLYAIIFRRVGYFGNTYPGYFVMYGVPTFLTWVTRKIVMNNYQRLRNTKNLEL